LGIPEHTRDHEAPFNFKGDTEGRDGLCGWEEADCAASVGRGLNHREVLGCHNVRIRPWLVGYKTTDLLRLEKEYYV
jgi:hypothetical protein